MKKTKKEIRDIFFKYFGLQRSYVPELLIANRNLIYQETVLDIIKSKIIDIENFTFLQVGGFDGSSNDIIKPLLQKFTIRGVIAEPQENVFASLKSNYKEFDCVSVVNLGVSDQDCIKKFYQTSGYASQVCSLNKNHLLKHKIPKRDIITKMVNFLTIQSILKMHDYEQLNFLQIDAEGHDYAIIKSIDYSVMKPQIIRFEANHMSKSELSEVLETLSSHNYKFHPENRDITAIQ